MVALSAPTAPERNGFVMAVEEGVGEERVAADLCCIPDGKKTRGRCVTCDAVDDGDQAIRRTEMEIPQKYQGTVRGKLSARKEISVYINGSHACRSC